MTLVEDFHARFGQSAPAGPPVRPDADMVRFRARLVREESTEVLEALTKLARCSDPDKVPGLLRGLLKELADLRYVTEGAAVSLGLPFEAAYAEVHRSNMSKTPAGPDNKPTKGGSYFEADLRSLVPDIIDVVHEEIT